MKLIVTEKPSVAQQMGQALGVSGRGNGYIYNNEWTITWCVGHLVTLSYPEKYDEKYKKWDIKDLPFLPSTYKYEVISNVRDQYKVVKELLNKADVIYNAGDSGREGEYIQRLVYTQAGVEGKKKILRVWIDSQTEDEIKRGIREAKPESYYDNLSKSAYMRAIEDYSMGINFSRALSCKFGYEFNKKIRSEKYVPISVGRVMTCVLGMVVDRENQINNFKPVNFYKINALHELAGQKFTSHWKTDENGPYAALLYDDSGFKDKEEAEIFVSNLIEDPKLTVVSVENKPEKKNAPLLYNLAELQSDCTKKFKISPDKTLEIAQSLYEKKMTTYPRTDARVLSTPVAKEIGKNVQGLTGYGPVSEFASEVMANSWYKGIENKRYTDDKKITDHYAIIPTGQSVNTSLSDIEEKVYQLICKRFLSIFYPPAEFSKTAVSLKHSTDEMFYISERVQTSLGYMTVLGKEEKADDESSSSVIASLKKGQVLDAEFSIAEGETKPPKRYTSGSMILAMENAGKLIEDEELREQIDGSGIGTSATRAEVIKKLVSNKYIAQDNKTQILTPTQIGYAIYDVVQQNIPQMLSPKMTASWEKGLASIERGQLSQEEYIEKLYGFIRKVISNIGQQQAEERPEVIRTERGLCPVCGNTLYETDTYFMCSKYSKKDKKACKFAFSKTLAGRTFSEEEIEILLQGGTTDTLYGFISKKGNEFDSKIGIVDGAVSFITETSDTSLMCPKCHKPMKESKYTYECDCGFSCYHTMGGRKIGEEEMQEVFDCMLIEGYEGFTDKNGNPYDAWLMFDGTNVFLGKKELSGRAMEAGEYLQLLQDGHTDELEGFTSAKGNSFSAKLKLEKGQVKFDFPEKEKKTGKGKGSGKKGSSGKTTLSVSPEDFLNSLIGR